MCWDGRVTERKRKGALRPRRPLGQRVVPALRQEEPPVQRGQAGIGDHVHADRDLAVGHIPRGPSVLPGHPWGGIIVLQMPAVSSSTPTRAPLHRRHAAPGACEPPGDPR